MTNIFEENSYRKEIETKIKRIDKDNKIIELEDTVFYGKSGGQPGDIGEIIANGQKIEINETLKRENCIEHISNDVNNIA